MNTEEVTLVAALLAAISSVGSLVVSIISQKSAEFRSAHRKLMESYLEEIGRAIHEAMATTSVYLSKIKDGKNGDSWREKAETARKDLANLRRKVRYSLWGIDSGLRDLSRLFSWVAHNRDFPEHAQKVFDKGEQLRKSIDGAIRWSYQQGRPPGLRHRLFVEFHSYRLRSCYKKVMLSDLSSIEPEAE